MEDCVLVLSEAAETDLDVLLITQVRCHVTMDQMTRSPVDWVLGGQDSKGAPAYFVSAMQMQLDNIRRNLTINVQLNSQ